MHANLTEYAPLKMSSSKKSKKAKKVQNMSLAEMINAKPPRQEPAPAETVEKRAQLIMHRTADDMDKYIDSLNVRQAKVLMQKLKAIFGESV
jgi:3-keto-L-gulonate-6-phosphate decarboxylase